MLYFSEFSDNKSQNPKDLWGKICSCMDWITVASSGFDIRPSGTKDSSRSALQFTHFIVTVDMLVEGVRNLWNTLSVADNEIKYPRLNDNFVFKGEIFGKEVTDEEYFKHIRAFFGIHAVNGNSQKIEGIADRVRFFSSWSFSIDNEEFAVQIYASNKEAEEKFGGFIDVKISDLITYAIESYETLENLIEEIDKLHSNLKRKIIKETNFKFPKDDTTINQLIYLRKKANEMKLAKSYYRGDINTFIMFLKVDLDVYSLEDKSLVENYLMELKTIIKPYKNAVSTLELIEIDNFNLFNVKPYSYKEYFYEYGKVLSYCTSPNTNADQLHFINSQVDRLIKNSQLPRYAIKLNKVELNLLIRAYGYTDCG